MRTDSSRVVGSYSGSAVFLVCVAIFLGLLAGNAIPALATNEGLGGIASFGKEVNKTKVEEREEEVIKKEQVTVTETEENVCTAASGDVCQAGKKGSGPGELSMVPQTYYTLRPEVEILLPGSGVAVSSAGDVYVADTANDRVEWFSSSGVYEGQFSVSEPEDIAIDDSGKTVAEDPSVGDVYVVDAKQGVVDKFSATGEHLFAIADRVDRGLGQWRAARATPDGHLYRGRGRNAVHGRRVHCRDVPEERLLHRRRGVPLRRQQRFQRFSGSEKRRPPARSPPGSFYCDEAASPS